MTMIKDCLIVDNEDQTSLIEAIERVGKTRGLEIRCEQFNVGQTQKDEYMTDNKIDADKVIAAFKADYKKNFDLAAFDWDLSDDVIDGVELIRKFEANGLLKHTPKLLYSGLIDDILTKLLDDHRQRKQSRVLEKLKALIKLNLIGYFDRTGFEYELVGILKKTEENLDFIIEEEFGKYPDVRFDESFVSESFRGKTLAELAVLLESDVLLRNAFKREIVQQVMAYLTEKI